MIKFLWNYLQSFILNIQFLTVIPLPVRVNFDRDIFAKGIVFYPLIGLGIGGISALVYWGILIFNNHWVAALLTVTTGILLTGGLHLDGFADSCDGLLSSRPKEKILEIMKDSRIGVFGSIGLMMILVSKIILFANLPISSKGLLAAVIMMISRFSVAALVAVGKYAGKPGSVAESLCEKTGMVQLIIVFLITIIIGFLLIPFKIIILLIITVCVVLAVLFFSWSKIGGITGDIMGATIELTEVVLWISCFLIFR